MVIKITKNYDHSTTESESNLGVKNTQEKEESNQGCLQMTTTKRCPDGGV